MKIIITNRIYLYSCLNPNIRKRLLDHLTIVNPKYTEALKAGRKTFHIPQTVSMFQQHTEECFSIPRGAENFLNKLLDKFDPSVEFEDRTTYDEKGINYECSIAPRKDQIPVIERALMFDSGVISAPTGVGKTAMAICLIAHRQQKTFIIVHTKLLLYQWRDRIKEFLNYECGIVGDGKFIIKDITVGLKTSVINKCKETAKLFGYLIVDEAHKVSSTTFTEACNLFQPFYLTGLTATARRRDGLSKFIFFSLGDLVYHIDKSESVKNGKILKPKINKIETNIYFKPDSPNEAFNYTQMISKLKNSEKRNRLICEKIIQASKKNFSCCLVISDHTVHLKHFQDIFDFLNVKYHLLTGKLTTKQTKKITKELEQGKVEILLVTANLITEGFDSNRFTDQFFTMPISYDGRLEQLIGRLVRKREGKKTVTIHDFVDLNEVCQSQWKKRKKVYDSY